MAKRHIPATEHFVAVEIAGLHTPAFFATKTAAETWAAWMTRHNPVQAYMVFDVRRAAAILASGAEYRRKAEEP